ncbi:uncharacterized protein UV8b_05421 [Ustilaginoidea virens]|uniref:Uncharacterized protein n=2 Tax=Ustilaginoidea virens TaxID=1159556 RepID=A0A8E5HTD1_USTVR|nr:uncharacterized protein UV8b_05421 [Ustilaginoidea virens]QUC21178.1 hypothetical protein UV8b_05421 [Ustilaginoidea virens]
MDSSSTRAEQGSTTSDVTNGRHDKAPLKGHESPASPQLLRWLHDEDQPVTETMQRPREGTSPAATCQTESPSRAPPDGKDRDVDLCHIGAQFYD